MSTFNLDHVERKCAFLLSLPGNRIKGFDILPDEAGSDTAYYNLVDQRVGLSQKLLTSLYQQLAPAQAELSLEAVLTHEGVHSMATKFMFEPSEISSYENYLFQRLEDCRVNAISLSLAPYLEPGFQDLYNVVATNRKDKGQKPFEDKPIAQELHDLISTLSENAHVANFDMRAYLLRDQMKLSKTAYEASEIIIPKILALTKDQPDPFDQTSVHDTSRTALKRIHSIIQDLAKYIPIDQLRKMEHASPKSVDDVLREIEKELQNRPDKSQPQKPQDKQSPQDKGQPNQDKQSPQDKNSSGKDQSDKDAASQEKDTNGQPKDKDASGKSQANDAKDKQSKDGAGKSQSDSGEKSKDKDGAGKQESQNKQGDQSQDKTGASKDSKDKDSSGKNQPKPDSSKTDPSQQGDKSKQGKDDKSASKGNPSSAQSGQEPSDSSASQPADNSSGQKGQPGQSPGSKPGDSKTESPEAGDQSQPQAGSNQGKTPSDKTSSPSAHGSPTSDKPDSKDQSGKQGGDKPSSNLPKDLKDLSTKELEQLRDMLKQVKENPQNGFSGKNNKDHDPKDKEAPKPISKKELSLPDRNPTPNTGYGHASAKAPSVATDTASYTDYTKFLNSHYPTILAASKLFSNMDDRVDVSGPTKLNSANQGPVLHSKNLSKFITQGPTGEPPPFFKRPSSSLRRGHQIWKLEKMFFSIDGSSSMSSQMSFVSDLLGIIYEAARKVQIPVAATVAYDGAPTVLSTGTFRDKPEETIRLLLGMTARGGTNISEGSLGHLVSNKGRTTPKGGRLIMVTDCETSAEDINLIGKYTQQLDYPGLILSVGSDSYTRTAASLFQKTDNCTIQVSPSKSELTPSSEFFRVFSTWMKDPDQFKRTYGHFANCQNLSRQFDR